MPKAGCKTVWILWSHLCIWIKTCQTDPNLWAGIKGGFHFLSLCMSVFSDNINYNMGDYWNPEAGIWSVKGIWEWTRLSLLPSNISKGLKAKSLPSYLNPTLVSIRWLYIHDLPTRPSRGFFLARQDKYRERLQWLHYFQGFLRVVNQQHRQN